MAIYSGTGKFFKSLLVLAIIAISLTNNGCVTVTENRYSDRKSPEKSLVTYTQLGLGYLQRGRPVWARQRLQKALQIDPKYPPANHAMALVWQFEGEYALAEEHFLLALRHDKKFTMATHHLGRLYAEMGKRKQAELYLSRATEDQFYENRPMAFNDRALNFYRGGDIKSATTSYTEALRLSPYNADVLLNISMVYFESQQYSDAYRYYDRFLGLTERKQVSHSARSLWLGIQLADQAGQTKLSEELAAELKQSFTASTEYQRYLALIGERATGK